MKPKILFIDNDPDFFRKISSKILGNNRYDFIPENDSDLDDMLDAISMSRIETYVRDKITENHKGLRLIICDLELRDNDFDSGPNLIHYIRNNLEIPGNQILPKLIPIFSLTNYSNRKCADNAIKYGATHNINKRYIEEIYFPSIVESMTSYYNMVYSKINLDEWMQGISSDLEFQGKLIKTRFDDIDILIQGNHEEILQKFDLLFNVLFESFNTDTKQKIFENFKDELSKTLNSEIIEKINQSIWDKIKEAIKEVNNGGGFKAFVDTSYDILNQAGILDGKVKLIGIAIKGMFGILASNK